MTALKNKPNNKNNVHNALLEKVAQSKDKNAFIELFNFFAPRLKSWLMGQGAEETFVEDIIQNTMITVWEKSSQFDAQKSSASTWIFTIARNKKTDAFRKLSSIQQAQTRLNQDIQPHNHENEIESGLEKKDDFKDLGHAIDSLPAEQKDLIYRAFFKNQSHQDIVKNTNLPLGTVKSRIRLALNKLRRIFEAKDKT